MCDRSAAKRQQTGGAVKSKFLSLGVMGVSPHRHGQFQEVWSSERTKCNNTVQLPLYELAEGGSENKII